MRISLVALPVLAGCSASLSNQHDYDTMLGELRRSDRAHSDASARVAAVAAAPTLDRCGLIDAALAANPDLEVMRQAWRAATAEVPAASALDDPMASYSVAPLSIGSSQARFGQMIELRQKLPFPGKRGLAGEAVVLDAEAMHDDYRAARLELAAAAAELHSGAYLNARALEINDRHRALVEQMRKVAEARVASGRGSTQDALQAEVELGHLEHERVMLETERISIAARMGGLLHRDPALPLPPADKLPVLPEPEPVASLEAAALAARPQTAAARERLGAAESQVALADRAYYPDFELMASYNSMWDMAEHRWLIGVGIDIPIQRGKRDAALESARARVVRAQAEIAKLGDTIAIEVVRAHRELMEGIHVVKLYDDRLLPTARAQVDAALAGFTTGQNDFPAVIDAERGLRTVELTALTARADAWRRQAALASAIGQLPCGGAP